MCDAPLVKTSSWKAKIQINNRLEETLLLLVCILTLPVSYIGVFTRGSGPSAHGFGDCLGSAMGSDGLWEL